jgi:hypothetical protein
MIGGVKHVVVNEGQEQTFFGSVSAAESGDDQA